MQPFTPAVELLRHYLVGTPMEDPAWVNVAKLVGFAVVLVPPSHVARGRAPSAPRGAAARSSSTEVAEPRP